MDINEFLKLLQQALKTESVKREILKIVNETDNNFVSRSESNKIEIIGNDNFSTALLTIQKEYKKLRENLEIDNQKINDLNKEIISLKNELMKKDDKIEELKEKLENSNQDNKKLNNKIEELEEELNKKDKKLKKLEENNSELEEKLEKKENKIDELKKEKKELQENIEKSNDKVSEFKEKLDKKTTELQEEIEIKNREIENLTRSITELENEKDELNSKLVQYENNCKREIEIYNKFLSLNDETKESLKRTFKGNSLSDFISCGVQNIENFWEYVKEEVIENKNSDIEKLIEIFYFLFEKYSVSQDKYQLLNTKEGEVFDISLHIKHRESPKNSGIITKVYLKGYKNNNSNKIIKQSIVKVG